MRHGKKFNHLSRTKSHRKAMLSNMACSLIEHKRINTTVAKAKALRGFVEPLITKSKNDTTHSRRVVFSYLNNKLAVAELFRDVAPKVGDRPGGYTRIIKTGNRLGDNAEMCMMELVDFNDLYIAEEKKPTKKRRRRRGGGKSSSSDETKAESKEAVAVDTTAEDKSETPKKDEKETTPKAEAKKKEEEKKDGDEKKGEEKKD
jgi:large subunit ribosomal protein L17